MAGRARTLVLAVLVVLIALGAGVWWLVLRDDAPDEASLRERRGSTEAGPSTPDGRWKVQDAGATTGDAQAFVGYRIRELFGGATVKRTATGRTKDVTGTLVVSGREVTAAMITAKTGTLESNRTARDTYIQTHGLDTDTFPEARFTLGPRIELPSDPTKGTVMKVTARGTLDLHGQEQDVSVPIEARWNGSTIDISGSIPIKLADYGIDVLSTPVVKIDDRGTLEFQLTFVPA